MTSLPSGLASISSRMDDAPNVRGAVDMAKRLRRAEALSTLAELDAPILGWPVRRISREEAVKIYGEPEQSAIDRHAALVIGAAYRSADRR